MDDAVIISLLQQVVDGLESVKSAVEDASQAECDKLEQIRELLADQR